MKKAIIIGAGPAGLTAAYELLKRTDIVPIILEKSGDIGGISKTIQYKGNRMDMGPHRFFSKSDRVMEWWLKIMPLSAESNDDIEISYQNKHRAIKSDEKVTDPDKVMLVIQRLTRIYFLRKFFAYPIQLSLDTLKTLGIVRTVKILLSFLWIRLFPRKPEKNLEDFIINKFGRQLYLLFFKDYTEKVWGIAPNEISAEWGAQRIKGVSLSKAIAAAIKSVRTKKKGGDLRQKSTETSLIEQFLYPKHGPGSLWEEVAGQVEAMGGKIYLHQDVTRLYTSKGKIESVITVNSETGQTGAWEGDYFFSTMPVQELIAGMGSDVPEEIQKIAAGLQYRDFINVGILLKHLSRKDGQQLVLKDNWIYIQERDVKVGRLMIYNNWGDGMIKDPGTTWIGMEYFCNKSDAFWSLDDDAIQAMAIMELEKMDLARVEDVLDSTVRRMEKTYPAYFGTYGQFDKVRLFTDQFANLFLVGRNGMHKYNNADHSMLTAMVAVDNIIRGILTKTNLWAINTEQEYHEEKKVPEAADGTPGHLQERHLQEPVPKRPSQAPRTWSPAAGSLIWRNRADRAYLLVALATFLLQFLFFKLRYPYANYMPDSYSYLEAAYTNADVNMWPVAYSKFLRLISVFTHSDKIMVGLQYLLLQGSSLVFLLVLEQYLRPSKWVKLALRVAFLINPLPLYLANYISADALFVSLSLLWLTSLLAIIFQPRPYLIVVQAILLLACFTVRYNAIYYPLLSILAFVLARQRWLYKAGGVALSILLVLGSVAYTSGKMKEVTGTRQFSAFGGWQLANNALYMYQNIPASARQPVPARFAQLEDVVRCHMDTLQRVKFTHEDSINSYFYLWSGRSPLVYYMTERWKKDTTAPYLKRWASVGPLYADYALYLMRTYPRTYVQSFLLGNAIKYAVPPLEFMAVYNMGGDSVGRLAKDWFNYKSQRVSNQKKGASVGILQPYPVVGALVNLCFLLGSVGFLVFGGAKHPDKRLLKALCLAVTLWIVNGAFSVFASPIVLRYQAFPLVLLGTIALFLIDFLINDQNGGRKDQLTTNNSGKS